ncbi:GNAT family N-acetyltransferase [Paenibacillus timonensis]|uniref:GNAT family N-acetyltransferase n=1 Tax=Paenibacillus timonensis TaxID=225915 RepID=A0ABW3SIV4_9BACL|nr:GNAT family N-acetyltransferase [Paenibacillus timonensis]MCH1642850.1 GNAT family N-acetyltransferase [Paenibacillus timonensis]
MIRYVRGTDLDTSTIYQAFQRGFADYIIQFNLTEAEFTDRFFGPEGNAREHSFVALDGDEAVGVVLGGMKVYETVRTMRCGALAVSPEYRGKGVSAGLMDLHREEALQAGCKQLFLEVIAGNDRAIAFYLKRGYRRVYDVSFYTLPDASRLEAPSGASAGGPVERIEFEVFANMISAWKYFHINWQNDLEYQQRNPSNAYYGVRLDGEWAGGLSISPSGKINLLIVSNLHRGKGVATRLLAAAREELGIVKFTASTPDNALLEGFLDRHGFVRDKISLHEMYLRL